MAKQEDFLDRLCEDVRRSGLIFSKDLLGRFSAALASKRFVLLTGLSGSGKTKLAQTFAEWLAGRHERPHFFPGEIVQASRSRYRILDVDRLGVLLAQDNEEKTQTFLPYDLIRRWTEVIKTKNVNEDVGSQELQGMVVEAGMPFSPTLNSFHAPLKALGFALAGRQAASIKQVLVVPVGADWTNREPLLGFPNGLEAGIYVKPDNGALDLVLDALQNRDLPFFLILDEMNLSHVERYFADFLSAMESGQSIPLHADTRGMTTRDQRSIPTSVHLPDNLFVIGTVNVDETTYMFSPKVLDRANVIEFRVAGADIEQYFSTLQKNIRSVAAQGSEFATSFLELARKDANGSVSSEVLANVTETLSKCFSELQNVGAEFGYRTANEIVRYIEKYFMLLGSSERLDHVLDTAILQKLLPKLHGSRRKLVPVLEKLAELCGNGEKLVLADSASRPRIEDIRFPASFEKICRMYDRAVADGFTSFAEA